MDASDQILTEVRALRAEVAHLRDTISGPEWLTIPRLMKRYGRSRGEIKRMYQSGILPGVACAVRGGRTFKVRASDADRLLLGKG